jgi:Calx-beta domain/Metallo-peptidase family M12
MHRQNTSRYTLLILCLVAALACAALFSRPGSTQTKGGGETFEQQIGRSLARYDTLRMSPADVELSVRKTGRLSIETSAGTFDLTLAPNDMRADNYHAIEVLEGGETRELQRTPSRTFKGAVEGVAGSQARFTIDRDTVEGLIIARGEKFFVEPASHYSKDAAPGDFLFYRESDVLTANPLECRVETLSDKVNSRLSRSNSTASDTTSPAAPLSPKRQADIATDADFEYFQASGSSATAANNDILSIMNQVDGVYQAEIGLTFRVIFQRVWTTSADPYDATTLSGLLDQVRLNWKNSPPAGSETRDVVHMWTGRDLDGFQTGLAYSQVTVNGVTSNGVVCRFQELAVGVSERQTLAPQRYIIPAHEIGHNFSATHPEDSGHVECALTIMSGIVQGNTVFSFCQFSRDEITNYINANGTCLDTVAAAAPTVQFSTTDYRVTEGTPSVQVTVTRSSGTGASTVDFQTQDGTASERSDYTTALGTLSFANGETTKTFNVFITDDAYGETPETFQILLSNPTGATLGTPNAATVTITSNEVVNGANTVRDPTFEPNFFVRQHYVDFLNRDPDAGGQAFWVGQTTGCGSRDPLVCRINVSAAFFLSIEFQETGFYAIRVQRVAFGRRSSDASTRMTYRELIRDQRQVGAGVVVGQAGYEQLLDANKQAYALRVVSTSNFAGRFPQTTIDSYVDALFSSAGVAPTPTERQNAINAFNNAGGGLNGRAAALRSASESTSVRNAEFNTAFVLLQYHGYLRRNPTDAPDTNDAGYQFWLGKLNQFGGNYIAAEMVKAFITSDEYQKRFGQ